MSGASVPMIFEGSPNVLPPGTRVGIVVARWNEPNRYLADLQRFAIGEGLRRHRVGREAALADGERFRGRQHALVSGPGMITMAMANTLNRMRM